MITKFTFFDKFGTQYPASREYKNTLKTKTCENGYKPRELTPDSLQGVKMRFWRKKMRDSGRKVQDNHRKHEQRGWAGAGRMQTCIPGWYLVERKLN